MDYKIVLWTIGGIAVFALCAIGSYFLDVFDINAHTTIVNPAIRRAQVEDPLTSIANKAEYHNKLGYVIKADQDIVSQLAVLQQISKSDPNYDIQLNNLIGIEQIRSQAITSYNAISDNPDKNRDRDPWLPQTIDAASIPSNSTDATYALNQEITYLNLAYNHK